MLQANKFKRHSLRANAIQQTESKIALEPTSMKLQLGHVCFPLSARRAPQKWETSHKESGCIN